MDSGEAFLVVSKLDCASIKYDEDLSRVMLLCCGLWLSW